MEIREGTRRIENGTKQAIIEFVFTDYIIFVFQGTLSQFDIVIKYKKDGKRIRTPKHRKTFLYTEEQVYETDRRLYELEDYLKDHSFFRTSKTTIINLRRTKSIRPEIGARLLLTMDNQEKIIVSRQYAGSIKHALGVK